MGSPWRLREGFATSSRALHEDVAGAEGFEKPPRRLREGFAKASAIPTEASRRRHECLHLETIRQIMTSRGCTLYNNFINQSINCGLRCVLCCVFSSHPFWTSSSLDVPAGVTQEEGHTGFLIHLPSAVRALIFVARRIQPFLSLVDREVEFCVLTN